MSNNIKDKVNEFKKELLLEQASEMFEEFGYEQMKVVDLAKKAKISIGVIYSFFNSKEGLYIAYIEYHINRLYAELEKNNPPESDPKEKVHAYIELKFSYYTQKRKAIEHGAANNPLFFNTLYNEHSNPFQKIYLYLATCFIELNPKLSQDQAMRMAFALNGFSDGYISLWLEIHDDLNERVDEVCNLFLKMLKDC